MRVGQPTDQLYANMFLANTRAIQDGRMLVGNASVAPRTMKEFGTGGIASVESQRLSSTTLETTSQGTSPELIHEDIEEARHSAFMSGLTRRKLHTQMARGMRSGMGMETRGQPTLTPELTSLYSASFLRPTPERIEFTEI